MDGGQGLADAFGWAFWFLGELAFKWVPGTVASVVEGGISVPTANTSTPSYIADPVTVPQALAYLQSASAPGVWDRLFYHWSVFVAVSLFVSLLLITLIIYCVIRIQQIRYQERRKFAAAAHPVASHDATRSHLRWQHILEEGQGEDPQKWRIAILEADIMLNELLDTLGYKGETMADKMKRVERADFRSIDMAWEAHRFRNRVAHEGAGMRLDHGEVQRILGLYQRVFHEFRFVE